MQIHAIYTHICTHICRFIYTCQIFPHFERNVTFDTIILKATNKNYFKLLPVDLMFDPSLSLNYFKYKNHSLCSYSYDSMHFGVFVDSIAFYLKYVDAVSVRRPMVCMFTLHHCEYVCHLLVCVSIYLDIQVNNIQSWSVSMFFLMA